MGVSILNFGYDVGSPLEILFKALFPSAFR